MSLGRQRERQLDMLVSWAEMPRSPGHVFYDKLRAVLISADFDAFVETQCAKEYAPRHAALPEGESVSSPYLPPQLCRRSRAT
jgi:transposase